MKKVYRYKPKNVKKTLIKKRRVFTKQERLIVANSMNFNCAYCGERLVKGWNLDHKVSLESGGSDTMENLLASCSGCNNFKSSFSLEQFREEISKQVIRGMKYSVNFRMAKKFKLIERTNVTKIVFYFEKMESGNE